MATQNKQRNIESRKRRVRSKIKETSKRPRLSIFRSNRYFYAQIIDDEKGETLLSASSSDVAVAAEKLWEGAQKKGITSVVFDRGPYRYSGRIKLFADKARAAGFEF